MCNHWGEYQNGKMKMDRCGWYSTEWSQCEEISWEKHLTEETVPDHPQLERWWCRITITVLWASLTKFYSALLYLEGGRRSSKGMFQMFNCCSTILAVSTASVEFPPQFISTETEPSSIPRLYCLDLGCCCFLAQHKLLTDLHFDNALRQFHHGRSKWCSQTGLTYLEPLWSDFYSKPKMENHWLL